MKPRRIASALSLTLSLLLFAACTTSPQIPNPPGAVVIPETTEVADPDTRDALIGFDLERGTLRFARSTAQLDTLEAGDVLVSEPTASAPYGYLRRIEAVRREGGEVVLETVQASLTDAVHRGEAAREGTLAPDDLASVETHLPGVTTRILQPDSGEISGEADAVIAHGYDYEVRVDVVLDLEESDGDASAEGEVRVTGVVRFRAGYGIGVGIDACFEVPPVCVDRFEAWMGIDQYVALTTSARIEGRVAREVVLASYYFEPIVIWLGPVPLVVVPKVNVLVGASGEARATFELAAEESAQYLLGAKWTDDRGWQDLSKNNGFQHRVSEPRFEATMNLRAYGKTDGKLLLYNVAGPAMDARLGAGLDVQVPRSPLWRISGHLAARISFQIDIHDILRTDVFEKELFSLDPVLLSAGNYAPRFSGVVTDPIRVDIDRRVVLGPRAGFQGYFDVADPEGETVRLTAVSDVDGAIPLNVAFRSPGPRRVTVTARDPAGATASIVLRIEVSNSLPIIYTTVSGDSVPATVPYWIGARAYDPDSGELPCTRLGWAVGDPDLATPVDNAGGCGAWVVFGATGTRTVTVTATDRHGGSAEKILAVNVTAAPENAPPVITRFSIQAYRGPKDSFYCVTGYYCEVPEGAVLHNGQVGDYHPPLYLSVEATDDGGAPLTVTWTCRTGGSFALVIDNGDGTWRCDPIYSSTQPIEVRVEVSDGVGVTPMSRSFIMLEVVR